MADRFAAVKRFFETTVTAVTSPSEGRSRQRGKDFMFMDLTYGADRAEL